ncbi:hypothetical protein [Micromonospora endolithica]|uniref:Uncharacterized protein n=1 Tax=Micromonospora endolithica TaxID=230091 RepID=A0A3A9ZAB3_9ACTN|nr:hypothetical protein [Micromonospora endolithica]RKN45228.1 hypothetical protein D7223_16420 [Micromonospora endolithica]TWJ23097.1 hypothetical protein JD76_03226 [Micromonospora endolithica]
MTAVDVLAALTVRDWIVLAGIFLVAGGVGALVWYWAVPARPAAPQPDPPAAATFDEHTATAAALLTPDDPLLDDDAVRIADAVARAVDQYASYLIAKRTGMAPDVLHRLGEAMYADLAVSLTGPQLARAVLIGLHQHADERARHLIDQFRNLPTAAKESL